MVHGVVAGGLVQRAGVREERAGSRRLHAVHDLARESRVQIGVVARLAEMQLDGDHFVLATLAERPDLVRKADRVAQPLDLGEAVIRRVLYGQSGQIYGNGHGSSLKVRG